MQNFMDAVRRYTGYTRFIAPAWAGFVAWVDDHPKTAAVMIVGLAVVAAL